MDAIRRIGKKPPGMIGHPTSKPRRVVLDFFLFFFWSCRLSVIADGAGRGKCKREKTGFLLLAERAEPSSLVH